MGFPLPPWFTPTKANNPCDNMADCIACKFCSHAPIEFERGVRKYEARIAKLIVMWDKAETVQRAKSYNKSYHYDPAQQATNEQLAGLQSAAAWGNPNSNNF